MLTLLIPFLLWLSSVRAETAIMGMRMPDGTAEEKLATKRESYHDPCPPSHAHPVPYAPPAQIFVKPYAQPMPIHYAAEPMITYAKPAPPPVIVKPVLQPKQVYPIYQKPMISYHAPIVQKPVYYAPMYQKLMYQPPMVYLKKYEVPVAQVVQKPRIVYPAQQYHPPKVIHVAAPQINYGKVPQHVAQPQPVYQSAIKPYCP